MICGLLLAVLSGLTVLASAEDYVPQQGKFPPADSGTYLSGELVLVDGANRRGGIRLDGSRPNDRYHNGPLHYFALLPYGTVSLHGAPAELKDIPLGTHVHGYFHLPPVGDEATIPPLPKDFEKFAIKHNHAVSIEDDFSFYARRGQSWKVVSLDVEKGKLNVEPHGERAKDGVNSSYTFDINEVTRIWKGRTVVELSDIAPGQVVQFNLGWSQGWRDKEFTVSELWLDDVARQYATEQQRKKHVRYQQQRWLPGWIDRVEHNDFGGGVITLTLFGGMDASLYADLKKTQDKGFGVATAEKTLRTWFHRADKKIGQVLEWKETPNPPPGSSGIQVRLQMAELLEGYRPGRCVRVKCHDWIFVTMPTEERIKSLEDQKRSAVFAIP